MSVRIQASFGGVDFWATEFTGSGIGARRVAEHAAYGREGSELEDTGRASRREVLTTTLTFDELTKLEKLAAERKTRQFTHPLFGTFRARLVIGERSGSGQNVDHLEVQLTFIEDTTQPLASPYDDETPDSKKNQAANLYANADDTMGSTPGDEDTQTLWTTYQEAWSDFEIQSENYDSGTSDWRDVEKAVDTLKTAGQNVIDDLRSFTTYQDGAREVISAVMRTSFLCNEYVEAIKQEGVQWFPVRISTITDLYTLLFGLFGHAEDADSVREHNDILDAFYLEIGTTLELPLQ